jgi:hypothetical protein
MRFLLIKMVFIFKHFLQLEVLKIGFASSVFWLGLLDQAF